MLTFVINLKKNADRLMRIDAQLKSVGVEYERLEAVYGKEMPQEEKKRSSNAFAWWCLKGYPMRDGELGAALSHQLAYRKLLQSDDACACIFEDDANPNAYLAKQLRRLQSWVDPAQPQVILLSDHSESKSMEWGVVGLSGGAFAEGYVVTRKAAAELLRDNFPVKVPADSWTYWAKQGVIKLYRATPAACDQAWEEKDYRSDVTPDNTIVVDVRRMSTVQKVFWKMKRAIGMMIAKVLY